MQKQAFAMLSRVKSFSGRLGAIVAKPLPSRRTSALFHREATKLTFTLQNVQVHAISRTARNPRTQRQDHDVLHARRWRNARGDDHEATPTTRYSRGSSRVRCFKADVLELSAPERLGWGTFGGLCMHLCIAEVQS